MIKTKDIRNQLHDAYLSGCIRDAGYDCVNGREYVDLRNVTFEVDEPYIIKEAFGTKPRMDEMWYVKNYEPRIEKQFDGLIATFIRNPESRQAILLLALPDEYIIGGYICTMYIHVFLEKIDENKYIVDYIVHMRSSDVIDFMSDVAWHEKIRQRIENELVSRTGWTLYHSNMVWVADSIQISLDNCKKYFDD